ncbi:sulfate anion transporter 1 [Tachyglossus aculeatus]|uniref:sulfate anion transporter 1 n=1 Tax=Tachyglossus aculeatus TaxID=9261 RepID=UPI0018F54CF5|nr:sulfate anion transporter 1 [Tachyglossus aculeatus]XP_038626170.1 sulfate anion transporter 1 [Tachyglossus aculeatus]XP_038626171.1 sulfate anion transporter 1 [Tachyglossus aculeatus]
MEVQSESMAVGNRLQFPVLVQRSPPGKGRMQERIKAKLRKNCFCTTRKLKTMVLDFFPVVGWLPHYRFKEYIWGDIMSGLIIGIILVPQAIAYSLLAGLKPIYCLYTSFFANIIYFMMGTSRHVSVGIFSLLSLMVGQVVDRELQLAGFDLNDDSSGMPTGNTSGTNLTTVPLTVGGMSVECGKECYAISIATALTFLAGVYQVLMGLFHLGFISMYLSEPLLDGFATGASLTILTSQVKYLFGIKIPRHHSYGMFLVTWINLFQNISQANMCDVVTSAICLVVLVTAKELTDRYKQKLKIPLPMELIVIIVATLISHYGNLNERYASSISGEIPTGFIAPKVPDFQLMQRVALDAVPLAVIGFAFTVSLSEMFAKKFAYTIKANQEMFAIGFCNIIPSFFHSIITSAALAKSLVKTSTGCHTQVSSVVSAVVVLLVLLFFAPLFYSLQKCVLACIIIVSLRGALRKFKEVAKQYRLSKIDTLVWCVTMASCALISTEIGLLVGAVFSIMCIVSRTQWPHTALLGQIENTVFYEDDREYENLLPVLKIKVFRFEAPLYYANKDFFVRSLYRMTGLDPVLETAKRKKGAKGKRIHSETGNEEEASWKGLSQIDTTSSLVPNQVDFQTIIIDCSSVLFLDTAGINTFKEIAKDYKEVNIAVLLACCNPSVIDSLKRGGYFGNAEITKELVFYSVHSAIQFVREREGMVDSTV